MAAAFPIPLHTPSRSPEPWTGNEHFAFKETRLSGTSGWLQTGKGRGNCSSQWYSAPLSRKPHHEKRNHPPSQRAPPPWKRDSVPHSGVYASLSNFEPIPKTAKNKEELKLKGKFRSMFTLEWMVRHSLGAAPLPGTQRTGSAPAPALQSCSFWPIRCLAVKRTPNKRVLWWAEGAQAPLQRGPRPPSHVQQTHFYIWGGGVSFVPRVVLVLFSSLVTEVDVVAHSGLLWTMRQVPVRSQRRGGMLGVGGVRLKPMGKEEFLLL